MPRRILFIVPLVTLIFIVSVGLIIFRLAAAQDTAPPPTLPEAMKPLRVSWTLPVELPAFLPPCLTYDPEASRVIREPAARSGNALLIKIVGRQTPECANLSAVSIDLRQAPALRTLDGQVTTATYDRLQFARSTTPTASGEAVTLQWRCEGLMCRMTVNERGSLDDETLLRIAASVQSTR